MIDSSVLLRHLTAQPPDQARRATRFLGQHHGLILTDVILAEVVYVLESFYRLPRPEIAATAGALLVLPSVATADQCDFAEMYLAATAERLGIGRVVSFDRDLDAVPTVERIEPWREARARGLLLMEDLRDWLGR